VKEYKADNSGYDGFLDKEDVDPLSRVGYYILDADRNIVEKSLIDWALWFEISDRKVAFTEVGKFDVSTVFLGIDHSFDNGIPLLFETMVFDRKTMKSAQFDELSELQIDMRRLFGFDFGCCRRYATLSGAEEGHWNIVRILQANIL